MAAAPVPAPVLVLISKKGCGACEFFAPDAGSKVKQGYQPGQLSEWDKVCQDLDIGSKYYIRHIELGPVVDSAGQTSYKTIPEQFSFVTNVPTLLICQYGEYIKGYNLTTGAEIPGSGPLKVTDQFNPGSYETIRVKLLGGR